MNRADAMPYVSFAVDDALNPRAVGEAPADAVLVGWQCGFEPLFVAVWSYLPGVQMDADFAVELATDLLLERDWFSDGVPSDPDFIL